jgi:MFS family permease
MIVFATASAPFADRFDIRRVATAGMLLFAGGLAVMATVSADGGYGRLGLAFVLMGAGMGLAGAPATASIMASLPPERANVGSAVNDTSRELGGALGVAVVGSLMTSLYADGLSAGAPEAARDSLVVAAAVAVGALVVWRQLPAGTQVEAVPSAATS